jgi:DNA-binding winged helix-turn-helix (wHTH) protein
MALIERRDRVVFKDELLDLVWPNVTVEEGNLQVQIATLRRLLGAGAIATVPGRGYQFVASEAALQTSDKRPAPEPEPSDAGLRAISAPGRARLAKCGLACGVCGRAACRLPANRAWLRCPSST